MTPCRAVPFYFLPRCPLRYSSNTLEDSKSKFAKISCVNNTAIQHIHQSHRPTYLDLALAEELADLVRHAPARYTIRMGVCVCVFAYVRERREEKTKTNLTTTTTTKATTKGTAPAHAHELLGVVGGLDGLGRLPDGLGGLLVGDALFGFSFWWFL